MTAIQLNAEILRNMSIIAEDENLLKRAAKYLRKLAAEKNDPDWKKMTMHRSKMKEYRAKLIKKYGVRASKIATQAQKDYIKRARKNEDVVAAADGK